MESLDGTRILLIILTAALAIFLAWLIVRILFRESRQHIRRYKEDKDQTY